MAGEPASSRPVPWRGTASSFVAELTGKAASARILLAAPLPEAELQAIAGPRLETRDEVSFDKEARALRARRVTRLGAIIFKSETRAVPSGPAAAAALADGIAGLGIDKLTWSKHQLQLRDRVAFLRKAEGEEWPDLSDSALSASIQHWLAPHLEDVTSLGAVTAELLGHALQGLLPYTLQRRLDEEAPTHFTAPTGNSHAIDYESEGAPILAIRVQELFGLTEHPAIARGKLALTLHLLSPAQRPIQITRDLPGFWKGSWASVKAEMKGRYPRHVWPDDPANAAPTARAKPRGT